MPVVSVIPFTSMFVSGLGHGNAGRIFFAIECLRSHASGEVFELLVFGRSSETS